MRLLALFAAAWVAWAAPALAQSPLPDTLRSAGVTQAQWDAIRREARVQAGRANISEAALVAAAEAASGTLARSGRFDALSLQHTILDSLAEKAGQIADLQRRLDARTGDRDPAIAALYVQARAALEEGRLDGADGLLAQAAERDLAAMQEADAEAERRRLRAGETIAGRGQLAFVQADYLTAADHYARAADTVPQSAIERWRYTMRRGWSLYERSRLFGEPEPLRQAIAAYESALALRARDRAPADWASAQHDLGVALKLQGDRGAPGALERAVAAYEAALTVRTREADPVGWAATQTGLGNAFVRQGERGAPGALERAVAAYEAALTVRTREANPAGWALTQMNLGIALQRQGERGAHGALERAVAAYEAALTVRTREANPAGWADTQLNLGNALSSLGQRGAPGALARAVAAFEAALTVMTREADPTGWAMTQTNLGAALRRHAARGAPGALERAVAAYEAALTVRTREADRAGWASTTYNLALAYRDMGRIREARAAASGALEAYEQVGNSYWANEARAFLAQLPPD